MTIDEIIALLEVTGLVLTIGVLTVATAGGSVGLLALTAAAAEGAVVTLNVIDGQFGAAAVGAVFLLFDADLLGDAAGGLVRAIRSGDFTTSLDRVLSVGARVRNAPTGSSSRDVVGGGFEDALDALREADADAAVISRIEEARLQWDRRPDSVVTTASENAAYVEFVTRDALVDLAMDSGATRQLAEDIVEQTFRSGRGSLNEAEFRRVADYLAADPDDGPALFCLLYTSPSPRDS